MCQEPVALLAHGIIAPRPEHDVITRRVGEGVDRLRGAIGRRAGVHAHGAEIHAEARLEEGTRRGGERLAPAGEALDIGLDRGGALLQPGVFALALNKRFFVVEGRLAALQALFALRAQALDAQRKVARADRSLGRLRHAHHVVGHTVGFLLVNVVGMADGELGLEES